MPEIRSWCLDEIRAFDLKVTGYISFDRFLQQSSLLFPPFLSELPPFSPQNLRYRSKKNRAISLEGNSFAGRSDVYTHTYIRMAPQFLLGNALPYPPQAVFLTRFSGNVIVYRVRIFFYVPRLFSARNQQKHPPGSIIHTPSSTLKRYPPSDFQWYRSIIR